MYPSCQEYDDGYKFMEKRNLTGNELLLDTILEPWCLDFLDTFLIVKEPFWKNQKGFKIFNSNTNKLVSDVITIGKGPGEFSNPGIIVVDENNRVFWCPDLSKNKYYRFPIDSLLLNPYYQASYSFDVYLGFSPMSNVFYYPTGMFGFTSFNLQHNLVSFINLKGKLIDSLCIPNKILPRLWDGIGYSENPLVVNYNESKNKFVIASRFTNYLAVTDMKGNPVFELKGSRIENINTDMITFYDIKSDEDFIYCLYVGRKITEYSKNEVKVNYPTRLLIFDWEGRGIYNISLDHPIMFFAIDKNRELLIGSTLEFNNGIVVFDLSQL